MFPARADEVELLSPPHRRRTNHRQRASPRDQTAHIFAHPGHAVRRGGAVARPRSMPAESVHAIVGEGHEGAEAGWESLAPSRRTEELLTKREPSQRLNGRNNSRHQGDHVRSSPTPAFVAARANGSLRREAGWRTRRRGRRSETRPRNRRGGLKDSWYRRIHHGKRRHSLRVGAKLSHGGMLFLGIARPRRGSSDSPGDWRGHHHPPASRPALPSRRPKASRSGDHGHRRGARTSRKGAGAHASRAGTQIPADVSRESARPPARTSTRSPRHRPADHHSDRDPPSAPR